VDVHLSVLQLAQVWQKSIVADFTRRYPEASLTTINQAGFRIITVVLCLYLCERRQIIQTKSLQALRNNSDVYSKLIQPWQTLRLRFGDRVAIFDLPPQFVLCDLLLHEIIDSLYDSAESAELSVAILGQVYETISVASALNLPQRRTGGVYYTPRPIVKYMVQNTIDKAGLPLPTILDPACGGGAFLIEAYQYLLNRYISNSATAAESTPRSSLTQRQAILNCLHGVDIDAQAVEITRLSLWLKLHENININEIEAGSTQAHIAQANINVYCGNALVSLDSSDTATLFPSFDWRATFPNVLAAGGFDIVIGNPPYVDAETMTVYLPDWRSYCTSHYQTATGNWDLFCVFIEKTLQLCRVDGITSLIVPNKLFSAQYASAARSLLLQNSCLLSIRDYSSLPVFDASVYPVVYIAQKQSPISCKQTQSSALSKATVILYEKMQTVEQIKYSYPICLQSSLAKPTQPWSIGVQVNTDLMQRLNQLTTLGEIAQVTGAATVAEAYALQSLIQNNSSPESRDLQLVNSGTIDRYQLLWGQKPLRYLGQSYQHPIIPAAKLAHLSPKRLAQAQQTKIIVAGMAQRLECALDSMGKFIAGKSTVIIRSLQIEERTINLYFLLGLLNSRLLSFYLLNRFSGNRLQGGYFRIGPPQMRELPIFLPSLKQSKYYAQMIETVHTLYALKKLSGYRFNQSTQPYIVDAERSQQIAIELQALDAEIDLITYELYQLSETEIATVDALFHH
jgi:hypothetical protein